MSSHRAALPPSAHTTFVTQGAVVCSFLPRPLEQEPDALRVPFFHRNTDYDEFIFYHDGDFFSRDNVKPGYATLRLEEFIMVRIPRRWRIRRRRALRMSRR